MRSSSRRVAPEMRPDHTGPRPRDHAATTAHRRSQVVAKMQRSHIELVDLLMSDLRFSGAPARALGKLQGVRAAAEKREPEHFLVGDNYKKATDEALGRMVVDLRKRLGRHLVRVSRVRLAQVQRAVQRGARRHLGWARGAERELVRDAR